MLFAPNAEILRRDPPLRRDRRGLGEHEPGAADRARGQMREMPVVGMTVYARIFAHRGNADAVGELHAPYFQFAEEMRHRSESSLAHRGASARPNLDRPAGDG